MQEPRTLSKCTAGSDPIRNNPPKPPNWVTFKNANKEPRDHKASPTSLADVLFWSDAELHEVHSVPTHSTLNRNTNRRVK